MIDKVIIVLKGMIAVAELALVLLEHIRQFIG